ncbi:MAG TPA: hypothetical protein VLF93_01335 [Candidatus Saccharimonadales bacterium]|nr:hypothetical protein [Candidatus Saccharimonadales bacterium]
MSFLKPQKSTIYFSYFIFPIIYFFLAFFTEIPKCQQASTSLSFLKLCNGWGNFLMDTSFWLVPFIVVIFANIFSYLIICSFKIFGFTVREETYSNIKGKKFIFRTIALILAVIIYLLGSFNLYLNGFSYIDVAKALLIPYAIYGQSHQWKSVYDFEPMGIDTVTPGYNEVFLTRQSVSTVEQDIKILLEEQGYKVEVVPPNNDSPDETDLSGTAANSDQIFVNINTVSYTAGYSTIKVPQGMTAISFEVTEYGYGKK